MILRRLPLVLCAVVALFVAGCGFHLRKEANLPASMQKVHVQGADPYRCLAAGGAGFGEAFCDGAA